jgi:hypothetical protein
MIRSGWSSADFELFQENSTLYPPVRSGLPGVNYGHTCGLKLIHISGHNRHAVNKGSGRDESVTKVKPAIECALV